MIPTELHIKLVVYNADAADGLHAAALKILDEAEATVDPDKAEYLYRAYWCVLAVDAAYARFRAFSLDAQTEAVHALPDMYLEWRLLMEDLKWIGREEEGPFQRLAMLSPGAMAGDLVQQTAEQTATKEGLQFYIRRDEEGAWTTAVGGIAPPQRDEGRLQSIWRRLQSAITWASEAAAQVEVSVAPVAISAPTCEWRHNDLVSGDPIATVAPQA